MGLIKKFEILFVLFFTGFVLYFIVRFFTRCDDLDEVLRVLYPIFLAVITFLTMLFWRVIIIDNTKKIWFKITKKR